MQKMEDTTLKMKTESLKLLFDKKDLGKISLSRNPIIFDMFSRVDLIEKAGSGIGRIKKLVKERGLKVNFETNDFFRIIFKRPLTPQVTPQAEVTELEKKIIAEIENNSRISRMELSKKLGIGEDTIKEYIRKLREKNILSGVGETSAGYWEIIK